MALLWILCLFCALAPAPLAGGEKNGVAPNTVSLPSGPGSIEGLGESFEPMLQTGTAGYGFPIALPPGVGSNAPAIALSYDGGFGNGPLGYGWKFGPGSVKRQIERGVPRYLEPEEEDTFLGAGGMELVELQNGFFLSRIEGSFTRYRRVWSDRDGHPELFHWEAHSRDGTTLEFGVTAAGRVALPAAESPDGRERIFSWLLERSVDVHGNVVEYRYSDLGAPEDRDKYLVELRYGPGSPPWDAYYFAALEYEERPDWFVDYRSSFAVRTAKRLVRITVGIHGAAPATTRGSARGDFNGDGEEDALIRRYDFLYEGHSHWSLLTQTTVTGADGVNPLPPAVFQYGATDDGLEKEKTFVADDARLIYSENAPLAVSDQKDVELVDLNGDGLPDFLHTGDGLHRGYLNLGMKTFEPGDREDDCPAGPTRIAWSTDVEPILSEPNVEPSLEYRLGHKHVHLADMDADGLADLVVTEGDLIRYFPNQGNLEELPGGGGASLPAEGESVLWGGAHEMSVEGEAPPPPFDFDQNGGSVRTLDVNFDKRMDVVRSHSTHYTVWYNRGGGQYSPDEYSCGAIFEDEVLEFRDPRVKLADMNGDRLVDVARIESTRLIYSASMGWGSFAEGIVVDIPDAVLDPPRLERAELKDVNGDGLSDLVVERAESDAIWLWVNLGTNRLSRRRVIEGIEGVSRNAEVDWADMNGNGTTDIVYNDGRLCDRHRVRVVDVRLVIDGSSHARLLKTIDNGLGLQTEIFYRSSSDYYQDARAAGNPWRISNPKAVQVVSRIESTTGLDLDGVEGIDVYRTDFVYRDGYYDPVRRQFNGFGFVKKIVHGDERLGLAPGEVSGQTLIERYCFHTGEPDGFDNDGDGMTDEAEEWMGREEEALKGAQLWQETASLPDDPLKDGEYADDAVVFSRSVAPRESWKVKELCGPSGGALVDLLVDSGYSALAAERRVVLAASKQTDSWAIEQGRGPPRRMRVLTDVNALGDTLFEHELGEVAEDGEPVGESRYSSTEYAHNVSRWILGLPVRAQVRAGGAAGAFVSETRTYYDGEPFVGLPLGEVGDKGLPHRTESFISEPPDWTPAGAPLPELTEESAAIGDPRVPGASVNTARSEFDAFGKVVALLDANGNRREIAYDGTLMSYPVRETIFTGGPGSPLTVEADYNLALGAVIESRDFNGDATRYEYDTFGRPTALVRPGDTSEHPSVVYRYRHANPRPLSGLRPRPGDEPLATSTPLLYDYDRQGVLTFSAGDVPEVSSVRTSRREVAGTDQTIDAIAYVDGGGKALASLSESDTAGRWVVDGATWYNLRGQSRRGFQPYEKEGEDYVPPLEGVAPHEDVDYDALGRARRSLTAPDARGVRHSARTVYRPFAVDAWDGEDTLSGGQHEGTYTTTVSDGLGRTVRVIERNNLETDPDDDATEYVTRYHYNLQDALTAIVDAQENRKTLRYDGLGRKISMNDLSVGHRTYTYDAAGNLLELLDAKGQRTVYAYDNVGRPLTVNYLDQTGNPQTDPADVTYRYDVVEGPISMGDGTTAVAQNMRGRLVSVKDLAGESYTSFDDRGRVEWVLKVVPDPVTAISVHYASRFAYDHLDRMTERIYPDGDRVTYTYDRRSQLKSVTGGPTGRVVIADMRYLSSGSLERVEFGNGVVTTYEYDPRLRLKETVTSGTGATLGSELLHYAYEFDGVSNITAIRDLREEVPSSDKRHNSQLFCYDDLYRLTRYQLTDAWANPDGFCPDPSTAVNRGTIAYRHDRVGNLLFKSSPRGVGYIRHMEDGKDVVNLGRYSYAGGRSNRSGRAPGDPPGPYAVTGTESGRSYRYGPNGNMSEIDGLQATWDYEDRLVHLEREGKSIDYAYDAGGQRVLKNVTEGGRTIFVIYVDPSFEIRDGEDPTKYVFSGTQRVARVKGTLDPERPRIQRMRLVAGWNLQALAIELPVQTARSVFGLGSDPAIQHVATFDGTAFDAVGPDQALESGVPYWVFTTESSIRTLVGPYDASPPTSPITLPTGLNILGWPRLEGLYVEESFTGLAKAWSFDAVSEGWLVRDFESPSAGDNLLDPLAPASGIWTLAEEGATFEPAATADQDILFYHPDHLGSTSVVTDLTGAVVEETAFYPYGLPRNQVEQTWFDSAYKYTGKERDRESGLGYHEARYYEPVIGRFARADPLYSETRQFDASRVEEDPHRLNLYAYVGSNPLKYKDPGGLEKEPFDWLAELERRGERSRHYRFEVEYEGKGKIGPIEAKSLWGRKILELIERQKKVQTSHIEGGCYGVTLERMRTAYREAYGRELFEGSEVQPFLKKLEDVSDPEARRSLEDDPRYTRLALIAATARGNAKAWSFQSRARARLWRKIPRRFRNKGVPGALAFLGAGRLVEGKAVWRGGLEPGSPLQLWSTKHAYTGHSGVFHRYIRNKKGRVVGLVYSDQFRDYRILSRSAFSGQIIGARLNTPWGI